MLPTEDLFVYVYVLIDDLVTARIIAIPPRPGPAPASSDAELRCHPSRQAPADDCQQIDTSALPVKHTSRARGPDSWTGPGGLHAGSAATPRTPVVLPGADRSGSGHWPGRAWAAPRSPASSPPRASARPACTTASMTARSSS